MKFICFGSGSSGNCYYLESRNQALLIDLGIGIRTFKKHLKTYGLNIPTIQAIFVTHDHTDHVKAVGPLSAEFHIPVYASSAVHEGMQRNRFMNKKVPADYQRTTHLHDPMEVGNFRITPFPIPHDASDNNGYFIELIEKEEGDNSTEGESSTFCLITDCGRITEDIIPYMRRARYLVIEANYDAEMLAHGPYPRFLQERIASGTGHLENHLAAEALVQYLTPITKRVWLCHLSTDNNHPMLAVTTIQDALTQLDFPTPKIEVLRRTLPTGPFELL